MTSVLQLYLQGGIDHEGNVNARVNQAWTASNITKVQAQVRKLPEIFPFFELTAPRSVLISSGTKYDPNGA